METTAKRSFSVDKKVLGVIRARFLPLTLVCLAPALVLAWRQGGALDPLTVGLIVLAGLASQVAANALNEYEDFRSGLDFTTRRTPFSGGSGTLVSHAEFAPVALYLGLTCLLITLSIGWYFVQKLGAVLIAPGLLGLVLVMAYTRWINLFPLLCLLAPGVGFGVLMVNLTVLVLTGGPSSEALMLSVPLALLVSNLLLVNQLPDIEADSRVGRRHVAVVWGVAWAVRIQVVLALGVYLSILAIWLAGVLPLWIMLGWLTAPLALWVSVALLRWDGTDTRDLVPVMARNTVVTLFTPLLLAAGLFMGA